MDWIQLVLPTEGMQAAILAYRDSFTKDDDLPQIDWDRIEQDYFGWLDQQKDQMLGLNGKTEMVYFAVDPEDRIAASVHLYENGREKYGMESFPLSSIPRKCAAVEATGQVTIRGLGTA